MDVTSVTLGKQVRDYRNRHEYPNYNDAIRGLLEEASDKPTAEISN